MAGRIPTPVILGEVSPSVLGEASPSVLGEISPSVLGEVSLSGVAPGAGRGFSWIPFVAGLTIDMDRFFTVAEHL